MCQASNDESRMACKGAPTRTVHSATGDLKECQACGARVAHDLVDHPLLGFKAGCEHGK